MTTYANIGKGTRFAIGDGAGPEVFTDLAEVVSVTPPSDNIDVLDATHMQSPGRTREYTTGLIDPGECTVEMNFQAGSDSDDLIQAMRGTGEAVNCRITWPAPIGGGSQQTWTFAAILTGYTPTAPIDGIMRATATFKVTGSYEIGVAA